MNKEWAKKWVKALRSGKYKRTVGRLGRKTNNSYCCLGVLCEISGVGYDKSDALVQESIKTLTGLRTGNGVFMNLPTAKSLVELNDDICTQQKKGFKYIADIIEKHWEKL